MHDSMATLRRRIANAIISLVADEPGPSDPSTALTIPRRGDARSVTTTEAFSLSMVYRAVQILTTSVKQLSLGNYKSDVEVAQPLFMRRPSDGVPRSAFLEQTVVSLACAGNAYWRIIRDLSGKSVLSLEVLNPLGAVIDTDEKGKITGYSFPGVGDYKPSEIQQLRLLRIPGTAYGLGPIQAAQVELRGALDLRDYSSNWFEESGVPSGTLTTDQSITQETADAAKARWNESQGARKGVAVLGNNLKYEAIYLSPADAQFLESRQFDVTQIARLFGVPSSLMLATVEGSTDTYQNVAQDWLGFVRFSLMSYLIEIEDALSELLPKPQSAKFNVEALLRSDTTTRYAAHKVAIDAGFETVNEARVIEHMAPFGDPIYNLPTPATTAPSKEPANA